MSYYRALHTCHCVSVLKTSKTFYLKANISNIQSVKLNLHWHPLRKVPLKQCHLNKQLSNVNEVCPHTCRGISFFVLHFQR